MFDDILNNLACRPVLHGTDRLCEWNEVFHKNPYILVQVGASRGLVFNMVWKRWISNPNGGELTKPTRPHAQTRSGTDLVWTWSWSHNKNYSKFGLGSDWTCRFWAVFHHNVEVELDRIQMGPRRGTSKHKKKKDGIGNVFALYIMQVCLKYRETSQ